MSIATSVAVRLSPCLRVMRAGLVACVLGVGLWQGQPAMAVAALAGLGRSPKCSRIDISGVGEIRLTVYQQQCRVRLLVGSTAWPALLVLHLQAEDGRRYQLPLLRDSVARGDWRRLQVAIRALLQKT